MTVKGALLRELLLSHASVLMHRPDCLINARLRRVARLSGSLAAGEACSWLFQTGVKAPLTRSAICAVPQKAKLEDARLSCTEKILMIWQDPDRYLADRTEIH